MTDANKEKINEYDLETALKKLDEIAEKLSRENVGLAESLALYEEGVALVKVCNERLGAVERKINMLKMSADGEVSEQSFDTSGM